MKKAKVKLIVIVSAVTLFLIADAIYILGIEFGKSVAFIAALVAVGSIVASVLGARSQLPKAPYALREMAIKKAIIDAYLDKCLLRKKK